MPNPLIFPLLLVSAGAAVGGAAWWRVRKKKKNLPPIGKGQGAIADGGGTTVPPEDADAAVDAAQVVGPMVGQYDAASFHKPAAGDSAAKVAGKVIKGLHPGASNQQVAAMRRALAASSYNQQVYGVPVEAGYYYPNGVSVDGAFKPRHEGAEVLAAGFVPRRNIDAAGARIGAAQKWGALWIPDVNQEALKSGVSDYDILFATSWPDDSSGLEPPPAFWDAAVVRSPIA
jgi:hypothetical protein